MTIYNIGFIVEQALGHITHTKNLQAHVPSDPEVRARWGLIPFDVAGLGARIPVYKSNWTVRAGVRARQKISALAHEGPLDALFFHTQVPAVLSTYWIKRIPSVVSLDATPIQYDQLGESYGHQRGSGAVEQWKWRLNRDCFREARHLVAWSEWAKQGLVDDYEVPADKITVIPPGVTTAEWQRPEPRTPHSGPVKILFVGGDLRRKGGMLLLESFRALRHLGVELHLVTKDDLPAEDGLFIYHDMKPNSAALKQLYYQSDIFCLPTSGDCLPMVLSEAGAAGLPSISTTVAGIPEIICQGETGLLISPGDQKALTDALATLVKDENRRLRLGEQAVARVSKGYDAKHNAHRLLDMLKSVAAAAKK